ncbi:hypothetical protein CRENBAI_016576 [Crenichthys baileyi]|uniref:Uncharacterized protein n=1 Tax=Crenichthys baileyi TaxID=28760 RepID=A0AAV9RLF7_9TELE
MRSSTEVAALTSTGIIKPAENKLSLPFPACLMGRCIGSAHLERQKLTADPNAGDPTSKKRTQSPHPTCCSPSTPPSSPLPRSCLGRNSQLSSIPPSPPNHPASASSPSPSPSPLVHERETCTSRVTGSGRPTAPGQAQPTSRTSPGASQPHTQTLEMPQDAGHPPSHTVHPAAPSRPAGQPLHKSESTYQLTLPGQDPRQPTDPNRKNGHRSQGPRFKEIQAIPREQKS